MCRVCWCNFRFTHWNLTTKKMVPSQKFYESSSPTIFVCWFFCWSIAVLWGVSQTILMSLKEDASQFDNFFFCRLKVGWETNPPKSRWWRSLVGWNAGRGSWNEGADGGKEDLELVLGRFAQPFVVVQRPKTERTQQTMVRHGVCFHDWLIHQNGWLEIHKNTPKSAVPMW